MVYKTIHVLSQIPQLFETTVKALPNCQIINIGLTEWSGKFDLNLNIGDQEISDLQEANIVFGDPNLLAQTLHKLPNVEWMQNTWAGIDWYVNWLSKSGQKPPQHLITRFSGESFGQSMFEYTIGHIIINERNFFKDYINSKLNKKWEKNIVWDFKCINEMTICILGGTGAIGTYMANKFQTLGARVLAYGRSQRTGLSIDKYSTKLDDVLPDCDYLISVLPSTPQTTGLLNNDILKLCAAKKPVFINIGRGSVIAESEIIKALNNQWISGAVLDVFECEPLPDSSPLWSHPKVTITPHNSAITRPKDCVKVFVDNYQKFLSKQPMLYTIDWNRGY
ncbi:glyoxylate/hydroxypyruvate reductase A-like [Oppia nitens]|uniref:glyoxylate/hydroxypyruvate reductase A-like n=1 Tax=Oppia nitens TaxID=1686743 RepID=UPI0023DC4014|nr:glyoxylate/hydroxypyruvate reductase A-like [Oppia nitens]